MKHEPFWNKVISQKKGFKTEGILWICHSHHQALKQFLWSIRIDVNSRLEKQRIIVRICRWSTNVPLTMIRFGGRKIDNPYDH
jgi:hypothetical protein